MRQLTYIRGTLSPGHWKRGCVLIMSFTFDDWLGIIGRDGKLHPR
jgi:hypothetical protein